MNYINLISGVVVDMRAAAAQNPDTEVKVHHLVDWEQNYGPLPGPVTIIFDFGWAKKYSNKREYFGTMENNESDIHFPGVSEG